MMMSKQFRYSIIDGVLNHLGEAFGAIKGMEETAMELDFVLYGDMRWSETELSDITKV